MGITLSFRKVRAKKEHTCNWCGGIIEIGETYDYQACVDGDFFTWKNHEKCMWIAHELNMFHDIDGVSDGDFWDFITTYYSDNIDMFADRVKRNPLEKLEWVINHVKTSKASTKEQGR